MDPVVRAGVIRFVVREYVAVAFVAALLAGTAGRWDWLEGWAVAAAYMVWVTATIGVVLPRSPQLLAERAKRFHANAEAWDRLLLGLFGLETLARYVLAGLDERFGWSTDFPLALQLLGAGLAAAGFAVVTWSMWANAWFSTVVRIQKGHAVATGGPYRWVRHPGYVGTFGMELGTGLLLGSWPATAAGACGITLLIVRTALEDRTLRAKLPGYPEYATQVRWRLFPGIW